MAVTRRRLAAALLGLALLAAAVAPGSAQRLLFGRWQSTLDSSAVALVIISADGEGWVHGTLYYDPPQDGFAGAPFTTQIKDGAFTIRLANGTRYDGLHWCAATLCGKFYTPDETKDPTPIVFSRPVE